MVTNHFIYYTMYTVKYKNNYIYPQLLNYMVQCLSYYMSMCWNLLTEDPMRSEESLNSPSVISI